LGIAGQRGRGERQRGEERAHPHGCLRKANNLFTTFSEFKPEPLGAAALIPPGLQTLREWAYAGFTFDLVGAIASHILSGEPIAQAAPAVFVLALLIVSYSLRRRQQTTG